MPVDANLIDVNTAMQMFEDIAQLEYQNRQYLTGVGDDRDMMGTSLEIPVINRVSMGDRGFTSGDLPVTNIGTRSVVLEPVDKVLKSTVGDSNETLFAYDKIQAFSRTHIKAAAREVDIIKLAGITAGTYSTGDNNLVAKSSTNVGGLTPNTGFNMSQLIKAQTLLEMNGYDFTENLFLVGNVEAISNILNDDRFTDWDYNAARPITEAQQNRFESIKGVSIRKLGNAGQNMLPTATSTGRETKLYLIAGDAITNGYNKRLHSAIVAEPWQLRTSIVTGLTMGSTIVHPTGVIEIECDTDPQAIT
jgi:hypothetical protein